LKNQFKKYKQSCSKKIKTYKIYKVQIFLLKNQEMNFKLIFSLKCKEINDFKNYIRLLSIIFLICSDVRFVFNL